LPLKQNSLSLSLSFARSPATAIVCIHKSCMIYCTNKDFQLQFCLRSGLCAYNTLRLCRKALVQMQCSNIIKNIQIYESCVCLCVFICQQRCRFQKRQLSEFQDDDARSRNDLGGERERRAEKSVKSGKKAI
jgi:hypothetical protein